MSTRKTAQDPTSDPGLGALLRLIAGRPLGIYDPQQIAEVCDRITRWEDLPAAAEAHGLAPLVDLTLPRAGIQIPTSVRQSLFGLTSLHREANEARFRVLAEILDAYHTAAISVVVLKGAALAQILYPSIGLRPLSDIDLLVEPRQVSRAQAVLARLGFTTPTPQQTTTPTGHHHLPAAALYRDGHLVQVEVHRNALSGDVPGSLTMADVSRERRQFTVHGRTAYTLGHADMLYHLVRHATGHASVLRLILVADILGYAARFHKEIAWRELQRRYPFVMNALSLLHLVTPLPPELLEYVTPARDGRIQGVGVGYRPLGEIVASGRPIRDIARELFAPSEWWLRLYYGVGANASLGWHRWAAHPLRVGWWLTRRSIARLRWRASSGP